MGPVSGPGSPSLCERSRLATRRGRKKTNKQAMAHTNGLGSRLCSRGIRGPCGGQRDNEFVVSSVVGYQLAPQW